ncbi:MAG: hypothetical protein AB1757_06555 [Acidobacteriota bacterium]
MYELIAWVVVAIIFVLMIWALIREDNRRRNRTAQEFENELVESKQSLLRAGMLELDKFVGDTRNKRAAVEFLKDQDEGRHETGSKGDDEERTQKQVEP